MNTQNQSTGLDRRSFLTQLILAGVSVGALPALQSCRKTGPNGFVGSGLAPFKVWEEVLHFLKTSPDHLKARMEELIEVGDPEKMFDFVRDEFFLIPASTVGIGYGNGLKWGVDYALRSGYATAREKAELLNNMFQAAGITSKIVHERTNFSKEDVLAFFARPIQREFAPKIKQKQINRWAKELGKSSSSMSSFYKKLPDQDKAGRELGQKILNQLNIPEDQYFAGVSLGWDNYRTPSIEFQWENQTKYAHLIDPTVPFGQLKGENSTVQDSSPAQVNEDKVSVKMTYRDSISPGEEKELVSGEWLARDLVGHQMDVLFLNNLLLEEALVTPMGNVRTFIPGLALQAIGKDTSFMEERTVLGNPITLSGKRINLEGDRPQIGDAVLLGKTHPDLQKQVESMEIAAKSTGNSAVKLNVTPMDAEGSFIEGLSAKDFNISEDGRPVSALMENNQRSPRILILGDSSMSMPSEYRDKGMEDFIEQLKSEIKSSYPDAIIDYWKTPSKLFTWLLKASQTENDLIIYATDGHNSDAFDSKYERTYRNGPPAIVLDVYDNNKDSETFAKMAELTNGIHLPAKDREAAMAGITSFLGDLEIQPYTFTYSSVGEVGDREVTVSVDDNRVSEKTTYNVDSTENAAELPPRIIGLYLELKYANQYPVKRVLAGWDNLTESQDTISHEMAEDVHDTMLGSMQLLFEGEGPTVAAALTSVLEAKLTSRKWGEALQKDDIEGAKSAFQEGFMNLSPEPMALLAPIEAAATQESFTFAGGLRIALHSLKPGIYDGQAKVNFDYFPTAAYNTIALKPRTAFELTAAKTAQLAIRENRLFGQSTFSELENEELVNLTEAREEKLIRKLYDNNPVEYEYWRERVDRNARYRLFSKSFASRAFWNVDSSTGELLGILANGSGGGNCNFDHDIRQFETLMIGLSSILAIIGMMPGGVLNPIGGVALGVVAQYGQTLVKLYALVSEAILIMDADGMSNRMRAQLQQLAENVYKEIVGGAFGLAGTAYAAVENLIKLLGEPDPNCPY